VHCSLADIEALGKPRRLSPVAAFANENKYNYSPSDSQCNAAFLKLYVESKNFWIGKRETVDRIRCYSQIYFAICMGHA
jgi:hypothetical protein